MTVTVKEKKKKTLKAVLSYVPSDREIANKLLGILAGRGDLEVAAVSVDENADSAEKLSKELRTSDIFVIILSPDSRRNEWIIAEIYAAWGVCKGIVPIKTAPEISLPVAVGGLLMFDLEDVLNNESWDRILSQFKSARDSQFHFLTSNPIR